MDLSFFVLLLLASFVCGVPTVLNPKTLLQNAQTAQALNAEFGLLSRNDSCSSGQLACITGSVAECQGGVWQLERCSDQRQCFALPSVRTTGTFIACTSEANALSLIKACGGTGGFDSSTDLTVPLPTVNDTSTATTPEYSSSMSTTSTTLPGNPFTATLGQGQQVALPPTTATLKPAEASSLLSSLLANGGSTVTMVTTLNKPSSR